MARSRNSQKAVGFRAIGNAKTAAATLPDPDQPTANAGPVAGITPAGCDASLLFGFIIRAGTTRLAPVTGLHSSTEGIPMRDFLLFFGVPICAFSGLVAVPFAVAALLGWLLGAHS
jgi:hypothetical protein